MSYWHKVLGFTLGFNALLVGVTSMWHLAANQEEEQGPIEIPSLQQDSQPNRSAEPANELAGQQTVQQQLEDLQPPAVLPEVIVDVNDPIYQEILSEAASLAPPELAASEESHVLSGKSIDPEPAAMRQDTTLDHELTDLRLRTIIQLAEAARKLSQEAVLQRANDNTQEAQILEQHVADLRRALAELSQ